MRWGERRVCARLAGWRELASELHIGKAGGGSLALIRRQWPRCERTARPTARPLFIVCLPEFGRSPVWPASERASQARHLEPADRLGKRPTDREARSLAQCARTREAAAEPIEQTAATRLPALACQRPALAVRAQTKITTPPFPSLPFAGSLRAQPIETHAEAHSSQWCICAQTHGACNDADDGLSGRPASATTGPRAFFSPERAPPASPWAPAIAPQGGGQ